MNFFQETLKQIHEQHPEITISNLASDATYYAADTRRQIYNCLIQSKNPQDHKEYLLKIYCDPRPANKEFENTEYIPQILPDQIKMAKVILGSSNNSTTQARGWYIMEKLDLQNHIDWENYLKIYQIYFLKLNQINNSSSFEVPHLIKHHNADTWITQRINKWYNLPNQNSKFSDTEKKQINLELENSLLTYLPRLEKHFFEKQLYLTHGHFVPKEIYPNLNPDQDSFYLTDFGHLSYQYLGYDLSLAIWSESIMSNLQPHRIDKVIPHTLELINQVQSLNIFENTNYIQFCILERCLGTLYADIWASHPHESTYLKLKKHNTILELIKNLQL